MASLRDFILSQSSLSTGNLVRDHINNPGSGGGETIIVDGHVSVTVDDISPVVDTESYVMVSNVDINKTTVAPAQSTTVEVSGEKIDIGVCG